MLRKIFTGVLASVVLIGASLSATAVAASAAGVATYYSAGGQQTVSDTQAYANFGLATPTLTAGDYFSTAEILVKGGASTNDSVEIGWTINPSLNGDSMPHLFVYWTKAGVGQCYNAACPGYTAYAGATYPVGSLLTTAMKLGVVHSSGAWWFWAATTGGVGGYIGYINDTSWTTAWSTFSLVQAFGQVATSAAAPTTQMGNGYCSDSTSSLTIGSMAYSTTTTVNLTAFATDSNKYSATMLSARTLRYGGDGSCP